MELLNSILNYIISIIIGVTIGTYIGTEIAFRRFEKRVGKMIRKLRTNEEFKNEARKLIGDFLDLFFKELNHRRSVFRSASKTSLKPLSTVLEEEKYRT